MLGFNYISALTQITQMKKHTPLKIHLSRSRANKISNFLVFVRYFQQTWIAHRWYQHYLNLPHYLGVILKSKPSLGAFVHAYAWNYLAVELVSTVNFSQKKIRLFITVFSRLCRQSLGTASLRKSIIARWEKNIRQKARFVGKRIIINPAYNAKMMTKYG